MGTIIPLRPISATTVPAERPGLLFPLRPGGIVTAGSAQQRDLQVLRAVAAAVAVSHTAESLTEAKNALKEGFDPGAAFTAINKADLAVVVDEVRRVQANRTGAAGPDEEQRVVAAAVGADAVLVAAAHAKVKDSANVSAAARQWVAATEPELLAKAARAGAQREVLNTGVSADEVKKLGEKLDAEIARTNAEITTTNAEIVKANAEIVKANTEIATVKTDITTANTKLDTLITKVDELTAQLPAAGELQDIRERLGRLEQGTGGRSKS